MYYYQAMTLATAPNMFYRIIQYPAVIEHKPDKTSLSVIVKIPIQLCNTKNTVSLLFDDKNKSPQKFMYEL